MNFKILNGDAKERLADIESDSIDCCVTSPPYYALRDYGTGKWIGGDVNCDHVAKGYYKNICPKCGAVRVDSQIGLEDTPEEYIQKLVDVFREVKRVLKPDGTLWVNIGDSYAGSGKGGSTDPENAKKYKQGTNKGSTEHPLPKTVGAKPKDLIGIPWMLAFALRADGWYLRQDIIWAKPNVMPESVKDRCTKSHEYIFLLTKSPKYYFDSDAIKTPCTEVSVSRAKYSWDCDTPSAGKQGIHTSEMGARFAPCAGANKRDVWVVPNSGGYADPVGGGHYATYPPKLIEPCILAGCPEGGTVLDVFSGSGTTGVVALENNRNYIGIELNTKYVEMSARRLVPIAAQERLF